MKKIIGFIIVVILFFSALSYYNTQKAREKIAGTSKDEYLKIREVRAAITQFDFAASNYLYETKSYPISVENLITYFNKIFEYRTAVLNNDGTITVTNSKSKYSYNCDIVTENCKSKVVCLEQTFSSSEYDMGICE